MTDLVREHRAQLVGFQAGNRLRQHVRRGVAGDCRDAVTPRLDVADRFLLDPQRLCFAGHSDGGSYTLSLGLANGDVARHLIVSSAGFLSVHLQVGAPRIFLSHGTQDEQIPIDRSARVHVPALREAGYPVTFVEYDGPHAHQPAVVAQAVAFFLADPAERP